MKRIMYIFLLILFIPMPSFAQNTADYLILNDIGTFRISRPQAAFKNRPPVGGPRVSDGPGVLAGTGHFRDHVDKKYIVMHIDNAGVKPAPEVEVTQHTGGDSDRWLLHEVETSFRDSENLEIGPDEDTMIRIINNNRILFYGGGVVGYRWVNNNVVVNIQYTNLSGPKPEPLEVVQAYLAKFPSTITMTDAELKASAHNVQWIKDEIERRLWLCDKWNAQYQAGKATQADLIYNLVRSMKVFLNYREKYYSVAAPSGTEGRP